MGPKGYTYNMDIVKTRCQPLKIFSLEPLRLFQPNLAQSNLR